MVEILDSHKNNKPDTHQVELYPFRVSLTWNRNNFEDYILGVSHCPDIAKVINIPTVKS